MNSSELIDMLREYSSELVKIDEMMIKQSIQQFHVQALRQKIRLKNSQFKLAIHQLQSKQHNQATIGQMSRYFKQIFGVVVKQAHRLLQLRMPASGEDKITKKANLLKEMQTQLSGLWVNDKQEQGLLRKLNDNLSMLASDLNSGELRSVAKEYLHKQFLAIRMIAYRMYQQYVAHSHSAYTQQFKDIQEENEELATQIEMLKENNRDLKNQEKRMVRQLHQLKRVNDLIGKRYFTEQKN